MLLKIDEQHLARLQAPLGDDLLLRDRQDAHFRCEHDQIVVGDEIARGSQTVAVERRADLAPIREGDGRRAVPGLHQRGVILVERAPLLVHQRIARPRLRNQHHHRVAERVAALDEELERVVEAGGVGLALVGDRPELRNVVAVQFGIDARLTRRHPVDVAPQRIDLAVMRDHAIWMRKPPGREGVGGEALMDERQRGFVARIQKVAVVRRELTDEHHPLVNDGAGRHRDRIVFRNFRAPSRIDPIGDDFADNVETTLEVVFAGEIGRAADEDLLHHRLDRLHPLADHRIVDRHVAPSENRLALCGHSLLNDFAHLPAGGRMTRHKELSDCVVAWLGQVEPELRAFRRKEAVGDLRQDAASVAKRRVGADRAPVVEIDQDLQALFENVMRLPVLHVRHEADAARIVFLRRVVEAHGARNQWIGARKDARRRASEALGQMGLSVHLSAPLYGRDPRHDCHFQILKACRGQNGCVARSQEALRVEFFSIFFRSSIRRRHGPTHCARKEVRASIAQMVSKTVLIGDHARNEVATQAGAT